MNDTKPPALGLEELEVTLAAVKIPACPAIVRDVMREAQKDDPQLKVLARMIASDVGMSATAIKLANSPLFGGAARVKSVQQAVNRLGISNILNVVITVALRNSTGDLPTDLMEMFWNRASTLALTAGVLARRHLGIPPESAYTFALFQDAAIPVLMASFPAYATLYAGIHDRGAALAVAEQAQFQCDHAVAGWLLARNWGLPANIASAIRYHHNPERYILPERELPSSALALIAVTQIAEHVIAEYLHDASAGPDRSLDDARLFLGTSDADLDEFRELIAHALA